MRGAFYWALFLSFALTNFLRAQESKNSFTVFNADGTIAYGASILIDNEGFVWNTTQSALIKKVGKKSIHFPYEHPEYEKVGRVMLMEANDGMIIGFSKFGCFTFDKSTGAFDWKYFYDDLYVHPIKDKHGNIWSITMTGDVSFCYTNTSNFLRFDHSDFLNTFNHKELNLKLLHVLDNGTLVSKSMQDVWYQISGNNVRKFLNLTSKTNGGKQSTFLIKNGTIFKENSSGTFKYKGKLYPYKYLPEINRQLLYLPYDSSTNLHYISHNHLNTFSGNGTDLVLISNEIVESIQITKNNHLKVKESTSINGLINNYTLQEDKDRLWISHEGILTAIPLKNHVQKYDLQDFFGNRVPNFNARSIAKTSNGDIYFLQNASGIYKLKKGSNIFKEIQFKSREAGFHMKGLYGFYKQNDSILIGYGWRPEILKINIQNHTFLEIKLPTKDVNYAINDAQLLNKDTLLLFGGSSILTLDLRSYHIKRRLDLEAHFGPSQNIHTSYLDKNKNLLWLGMYRNDGLYRINLTTNKLSHFHTKSTDIQLVDNNINTIHAEQNDILWIGTMKGLQKIDTRRLTVLETYTSKNGLKNDHIVTITGHADNIWFGTFNGLVVLHKKEGTFQTFAHDDSFPDFEYNRKSILKVNGDSLFFGGMTGLIKINPKEPLFQKRENKIFLTKITYYDNQLKKDVTSNINLDSLKVINVPYKQNYLFLSFGVNEIFDPEKVIYRYRIKGINEDWVAIGSNQELFLQGIKSGDYTLQIQGFSTSNEPTNILEYTLSIDRPFYMKISFYLLCAFFLISGFITYIFYQKREFSRDRTLHELEAKSSQAQMLPHFTFNTINCIQSIMLTKGEVEANNVIVAYSKLLRHTLDVFHSDLISLKDEISYINAYLSVEKLRAHFTFDVLINESIDKERWRIPSMMFQPLIENAIKHGIIPKKDQGNITIKFMVEQGILTGEVIDNGIGREASLKLKQQKKASHISRATQILEERIYLFNKVYSEKINFEIQDLHDKNGASGTKSILTIPLLTD